MKKPTKSQLAEQGNNLADKILEYCKLKKITIDEFFTVLEEYYYHKHQKKKKVRT